MNQALEFPVQVLPAWARDYVEAVARVTSVDPAMCSWVALSALSATQLGRTWVQVTPSWRCPLTLWVLLVAPSGEGKSPVLRSLLRPLRRWQRQMRVDEAPEIGRSMARRRLIQMRIAALERRLASPSKRTQESDLESELSCLIEELEELQIPPQTTLLVNDATPERLIATLSDSQRLLLASDEIDALNTVTGRRYGGKGQDYLAPILSAHDGAGYSMSRKGEGLTVDVARAELSCLLCCQPGAARELLSDKSYLDRGLITRMIVVRPEQRGHLAKLSQEDISAQDAAYASALLSLLGDGQTLDEPRLLRLSDGALDAFSARYEELSEAMEGIGGELRGWQALASKSRRTLAVLAGLLHVAHYGDSADKIGRDSVDHAWLVLAHAIDHYTRLVGESRTDPEHRKHVNAEFLARVCESNGGRWTGSAASLLHYAEKNKISAPKGLNCRSIGRWMINHPAEIRAAGLSHEYRRAINGRVHALAKTESKARGLYGDGETTLERCMIDTSQALSVEDNIKRVLKLVGREGQPEHEESEND